MHQISFKNLRTRIVISVKYQIMMKRLSITFFLIAGFLMGLGAMQQTHAQRNTEQEAITITEYSDYQCPACAYYHPMVKKLKAQFGDRINIELKYYPLNSHQYAAVAARAAEAAKNQGKFLEMHNLLFEHQKQWSSSGNPTPMFVNFARELNMDIEQFKDELNAGKTQKVVMEEKQEGRRAGVNATPTFFIEGDKLDPLPRSYAQFEQAVQKYLNENEEG